MKSRKTTTTVPPLGELVQNFDKSLENYMVAHGMLRAVVSTLLELHDAGTQGAKLPPHAVERLREALRKAEAS